MNNLEEALRDKISLLEAEKIGLQEELEEAFQRIDSQIELCEGLLNGEIDGLLEAAPKKRGRPKKKGAKAPAKKRDRSQKGAADDEMNKELYQQSVNSLPDGSTGTTEEQRERAVRRFNPTPRPEDSHGGVKIGSTKGKPSSPDQKPDPTGHKTISMEDDLPEEE
ncbi:hypothetical protein LCGC14_1643220 [marine sediment metagenome]|uniref:Uncharacterized protein n=1 Tax=marine sediment metagenome TaxID=412755 RepID=A0A0F9ILJ8_9ZZZZ